MTSRTLAAGELEFSPSFSLKLAGVLELQLELFSSRMASWDGDAASRNDRHDLDAIGARPPELWRLAQMSGIDAVRLRRTNNPDELNDREEYLLLFREALLGRSLWSAIRLTDPCCQDMHARLFHAAGGFWLENLAGPDETTINGQPLPPRELVPLQPGMQLTLGWTELRFEPFEQYGLG